MKHIFRTIASLLALAALAGCASTKVTSRERLVSERLPRPQLILVYDFVSSAADIPADSALYGQNYETSAQSYERIDTGRQVGAEIAAQLVEEIRNMGMAAVRASTGSIPQINDIVIRGYLLSIDEGRAAKRVTIGFGSGGSELRTAVEGFQMTPQGLRKLGSGTVESGGGKTPGGAVGLAALIASGNPVGLIVSGGAKVYGEVSGSAKIEGRAKQTAKEIADALKKRFQEEGWI